MNESISILCEKYYEIELIIVTNWYFLLHTHIHQYKTSQDNIDVNKVIRITVHTHKEQH